MVWTWNAWGFVEVLPIAPEWARQALAESIEQWLNVCCDSIVEVQS